MTPYEQLQKHIAEIKEQHCVEICQLTDTTQEELKEFLDSCPVPLYKLHEMAAAGWLNSEHIKNKNVTESDAFIFDHKEQLKNISDRFNLGLFKEIG